MERTQIFDLMGELKLYGMKAAFDEIMATAIKRQHEPQRIVGDLLNAEINEMQARSIKYQLTIAKLPLAKDIADFQFDGTPINQTLVNDLASGGFNPGQLRRDERYQQTPPRGRGQNWKPMWGQIWKPIDTQLDSVADKASNKVGDCIAQPLN